MFLLRDGYLHALLQQPFFGKVEAIWVVAFELPSRQVMVQFFTLPLIELAVSMSVLRSDVPALVIIAFAKIATATNLAS